MVLRQWIIACFVLAALGFTHSAIAQTPATQPAAAPAQPAKPAIPQINTAEITKRANDSVGVDIQSSHQRLAERVGSPRRGPSQAQSQLLGAEQ